MKREDNPSGWPVTDKKKKGVHSPGGGASASVTPGTTLRSTSRKGKKEGLRRDIASTQVRRRGGGRY